MTATIDRKIEQAIAADEWKSARGLIVRALENDPSDHWLLTRLALTYYEERNYELALEYSERAMALAPNCPLVLWDCAGALDMLGRETEAIDVWKGLIARGPEAIAEDECGEGLRAARSLVNDCRYRVGCALADLEDFMAAREMLAQHVAHRGKTTPSIYSLTEAKRKLRALSARSRATKSNKRRMVARS